MRLTVCLLAIALIASSVVRGNPFGEECPESPEGQSCPLSDPGNLLGIFREVVGCPECASQCPCAKTAAKVAAKAKADCRASSTAAAESASPCCANNTAATACSQSQAKCGTQSKTAAACSEAQGKCCKQAEVADCSEACTSDSECCLASDDDCAGQKCCTSEKIAHLVEAAEHLQAAGLDCEAARVQQVVQSLRGELLAEKIAQLERLQGEIEQLRRVAGRQVLLRAKVVEVSLTELHKMGIELELDANCPSTSAACRASDKSHCDASAFTTQVCDGAVVAGLLDALSHAKLAKVLGVPTIVTPDGRVATIVTESEVRVPVVGPGGTVRIEAHEVGTRVDFEPQLLGNNKVRVHVHPRVATLEPSLGCPTQGTCPGVRVVEVDTRCEMELGKTIVIAGPVQKRVVNSCDADENCSQEVCDVQTIFLFTPELAPAGHPVSHTARPSSTEYSPAR